MATGELNIAQLATSAISLTDFLAKADASGVATKTTIQSLSNFLSTTNDLSFKGGLAIADTPVVGWYFAEESGTYTNVNNIVVDVSDTLTILVVTDPITNSQKVEIPISLTIDAVPTIGSTNVPQSGGTANVIRTGLKSKPSLTIGKNKYDINAKTAGFYINHTNGNLVADAGFATSEFIPVLPSTQYTLNRFTFIVYFDINFNYISGTSSINTTFTTPSTAYYVRFSDINAFMNLSTFQLEVGSSATSFEKYSALLVKENVKDFDFNVGNIVEGYPYIKGVVGKNKYNINAIKIVGKRLSESTGELLDDAGFITSAYTEVLPSTQYAITRFTFIAYYDKDYKFLSGSAGINTTFTTPANTKFVRFSDITAFMTLSTFRLELGAVVTDFESYKQTLPSTVISDFADRVEDLGYVKPIVGKNKYNSATKILNKYMINGVLTTDSGFQTSDFIEVLPSTAYRVTSSTFGNYYDANKVFISGYALANTTSFTTPANAYYFVFSDVNSIMNLPNIQLEIGTLPTDYEPYSFTFESKYIPTTNTVNEITVARYGSADFVGRRAIQDAIDSITDATISNTYNIYVKNGVYEATIVADYDMPTGAQFSFIRGKSHVNVIGETKDGVIITGTLPDNLGVGFGYSLYQTVYWNVDNARLENVTVYCKNMRYAIHIDGGQLGCKNFNINFRNIKVKHYGNTGDAVNWASWHPIGLGTSDGMTLTIEDSYLVGKEWSFYSHNNQNFKLPSEVKIINSELISENTVSRDVMKIENLGSNANCKIIVENSNVTRGILSYTSPLIIPSTLENQQADMAETQVIMPNTEPLPLQNNLKGTSLKITSNTTGGSSSVIFDETSTAFDLIIGDSNQAVEFDNKYFRKSIYGYQYKIGGNGLSGYAISGLDIGSDGVSINSNVYIKSLGKRLGDCSTVNKTLTLSIDGTPYSIVFDKNYNGTSSSSPSNYTNAQIITEIEAVIGSVATVTEVNLGKDYYPLFKGNTEKTNADTTEILAGMGVVFTTTGKMRKALNSDNRIDGICLDDCRVGDRGRVITCGDMNTSNSGFRFSTKEVNTDSALSGDEFGISTVTAGLFDKTASPKFLRCYSFNLVEFIK